MRAIFNELYWKIKRNII